MSVLTFLKSNKIAYEHIIFLYTPFHSSIVNAMKNAVSPNSTVRPRASKKPTFTDMFSGAGVFASAFVREGFGLVDAVEINEAAIQTHHHNLGSFARKGDVRQLDPVRKSDVIIAGPPCQGFSSLGKMDADDFRNDLSLEVARWAGIVCPKIVVIENVPQFLRSRQWREMAAQMEAMGYEVTHVVLNASNFGVAQYRERSFTFASKIGIPKVKTVRRRLTVRDAVNGLSVLPNGENNHYAPAPTPLAMERIRLVPPEGDKRDIMRLAPHLAPKSWLTTTSEATDVWGRMSWDSPANTLRACFLHPSKGRYLHPDQDRVISLREAARIHSIPDGWFFKGTPYQVARQIGNSVPFNLGRAVARAVIELL